MDEDRVVSNWRSLIDLNGCTGWPELLAGKLGDDQVVGRLVMVINVPPEAMS